MPVAARAPVKPRILASATRAALPLEDEVQTLLDGRGQMLVALGGEPGGGKSTALAHLAAVFPQASRLRLIDAGEARSDVEYRPDDVIIFVGTSLPIGRPNKRLELAPWQRDEFIEYLLARYPERTAAVIARISTDDLSEFGGSPAIWRIILDEMALDKSLRTPAAALTRHLRARTAGPETWEQLGAACFADGTDWSNASVPQDVVRLFDHRPLRRLLAAEYLATQVKEGRPEFHLPPMLSRSLVQAVARSLRGNVLWYRRLKAALLIPAEQPMAASLLHAIEGRFSPRRGSLSNLTGAYLEAIHWPREDLRKVQFSDADLSSAELFFSNLDGAVATHADFNHASLLDASLTNFQGGGADFSQADLTAVRGGGASFLSAQLVGAKLDHAQLSGANFLSADLTGASLCAAILSEADFREAKLTEADFTEAELRGANFANQILRESILTNACLRGANLCGADMEGMQLVGSELAEAQLAGALLTGASLEGADLTGCVLREAGLADVNLEDACLRDADMRGASFDLGSSRSGLVGSPIASEGSRTGFYTDDFNEQDFKAPEEIRKANLRNADLRGAIVTGVDFYLVDLRGAQYDAEQAEHFRRCGAILEDRGSP